VRQAVAENLPNMCQAVAENLPIIRKRNACWPACEKLLECRHFVLRKLECLNRGQRTYIFRSFSDPVLLFWYQDFSGAGGQNQVFMINFGYLMIKFGLEVEITASSSIGSGMKFKIKVCF
jgi:hypothetical protein